MGVRWPPRPVPNLSTRCAPCPRARASASSATPGAAGPTSARRAPPVTPPARGAGGGVPSAGRAPPLRNRVRSYFGSPHSLEPKTRRLVERIEDMEYVVTASAQEALILEASLVKRP